MNEEKPLCECHEEPMYWMKDFGCRLGGWWHCAVKAREKSRRWREANLEKARENSRNWHAANPEYRRRWDEENRERAREHSRRSLQKKKDLGLCTSCKVREPEPLMTTCTRCQRYSAEYYFLGYSTIPLAKGSVG